MPNSGDGLKRLTERIEQWDVQLKERLLALAQKKQVVLMGDLNVAHRDQDIWNAEAPHVPKSAGTTAEERESFGKLLESGFKEPRRGGGRVVLNNVASHTIHAHECRSLHAYMNNQTCRQRKLCHGPTRSNIGPDRETKDIESCLERCD